MRLALRAGTVPAVRAIVAVSASPSASMAASMVASGGTGDGNDGLFVMARTMLRAYMMNRGTSYSGSFRTARVRQVVFELELMVSSRRLPGCRQIGSHRRRCDGGRHSTAWKVSRCGSGK